MNKKVLLVIGVLLTIECLFVPILPYGGAIIAGTDSWQVESGWRFLFSLPGPEKVNVAFLLGELGATCLVGTVLAFALKGPAVPKQP